MVRLLDILLESKIMEMPRKRFEVKNKFRSLQDNIGDEILKILMYRNSKNQNHWKGKLNGYFRTLHRINKRVNLDSKNIFNILFYEPFGNIEELKDSIEYIESKYYKPSYHIDYNNLLKLHLYIKELYKKITNDFTNNKLPNINNYING